jgi:hypothetical protein
MISNRIAILLGALLVVAPIACSHAHDEGDRRAIRRRIEKEIKYWEPGHRTLPDLSDGILRVLRDATPESVSQARIGGVVVYTKSDETRVLLYWIESPPTVNGIAVRTSSAREIVPFTDEDIAKAKAFSESGDLVIYWLRSLAMDSPASRLLRERSTEERVTIEILRDGGTLDSTTEVIWRELEK